jgi:hypothetical protein
MPHKEWILVFNSIKAKRKLVAGHLVTDIM